MPEGPSIIILKELIEKFEGKKIREVFGNAKIDMPRLAGQKIIAFKSWGKQFFICFKDFSIRIHFLLFGSYSLDEQIKPDRSLRLALIFSMGSIYFHTCSVRILEDDLDTMFDWKADVMSDDWDTARARKKLKAMPDTLVCDALLDQQVFSGVGNIIKNEVLFRIRVHPETRVGDLPPRKLGDMIREARQYSFDFLEWKKNYVLKKNWLAHTKKTCVRCSIPLIKKYCGKTARRTFFCTNCQVKN